MHSTDLLLSAGQDDSVVEPEPERLAWASEVYRMNGVRLLSVDGQLTGIGVWSDLDGPHIREAIAIHGNQDIPVRYIDGPNIPMKYKVRRMKGTPVPLDVVGAMDKANLARRPAWEVRDRMLAEIKWRAKVYVYKP
jgi:hypothetical protein